MTFTSQTNSRYALRSACTEVKVDFPKFFKVGFARISVQKNFLN